MSYKFEEELTQLAKNIESVITNSLESVELNKAKEQVNSAMDHAIDEVRRALDQAGTKLDQSLERNKKKSAAAGSATTQKGGWRGGFRISAG